jgi:bifunctional UDP-N-acetylglucosamine pyrophosphorylase/glucosamine-1-phosphate N-acetyltransferase
MTTSVVILAAGLGTRMRSKRAKVLHEAGGMALVEQVVDAAQAVAPHDRIVAVTGHQAEQVEALLKPLGVKFARQTEQKGTGHALICAHGSVPESDLVMVLYGDTPLLTSATLTRLRDTQANSNAAATLITTTLDDPTGYGRVMLDADGFVTSIVEQKACTPDQLPVRLINSGIYCFRADLLWKHLADIKPDNPAHEYYLTDMAAILTAAGHRVQPLHVEDSSELLGINTRVELAEADRLLRRRKAEELMLSGVTIEKPETVSIDKKVKIGMDTIVEPFTRILGETQIGENCHIGAGSIIDGSFIADQVIIKPYSVIHDSRIASKAEIGPFSRLRMYADIGVDARIGNFVEVKKSSIGKGTKSQHLAYLGDADIGDDVNVGAGTITCNFDGKKKHETKIGAGSFVGSNSTLVAPIEIGKESYIGAGSVITDPVPDQTLALGRGRQVNKTDWVEKRKQEQQA